MVSQVAHDKLRLSLGLKKVCRTGLASICSNHRVIVAVIDRIPDDSIDFNATNRVYRWWLREIQGRGRPRRLQATLQR